MHAADQDERFTGWMRDHLAILNHVVRAFSSGDDRNDLMQEMMLSL